jgi:hypothetical protein
VTSIKSPGGPGRTLPEAPQTDPSGSSRAKDPGFADQVSSNKSSTTVSAPASTSSDAVVADLRAGRITPAEALDKLTEIAVQRSGAPPSMRGAVETQIRSLLVRDPLLRELVQRMGAEVPTDK